MRDTDVRRQFGRAVGPAPRESHDDKSEVDQTDTTMKINPERAGVARDLVEQETKRAENDD
jgi:hypothetical protein